MMKSFLFLGFLLSMCNTTLAQTQEIKVLNSISDPDIQKYDLFLVDLYGVVHDGENLINDKLPQLITKLTEQNKKIVFVSNAPRSIEFTKNKLQKLGLPLDKVDIITSGELVRMQFHSPTDKIFRGLGKNFFSISGQSNQDFLNGINHTFQPVTTVEGADFIVLTRTLQIDETIDTVMPILKQAISRNVPIVCANPDITVLSQGKVKKTAGYIAREYEKLGGKVFYYGKPYNAIYEYAISKYNVDKSQVVMIGDNLVTDILGANTAGISSILVLSGIYGNENSKDPVQVLNLLQQEKVKPTYILDYLH